MARTFVAQAWDPRTLRARLDQLVRSDHIESDGDAHRGTFRATAESPTVSALGPISGRYLVSGATVRIVAQEDLPPSAVFDRLARAGLHLISYQ